MRIMVAESAGHETVPMFMRYAHTDDKPVCKAAELVANHRRAYFVGRTSPAESAVAA